MRILCLLAIVGAAGVSGLVGCAGVDEVPMGDEEWQALIDGGGVPRAAVVGEEGEVPAAESEVVVVPETPAEPEVVAEVTPEVAVVPEVAAETETETESEVAVGDAQAVAVPADVAPEPKRKRGWWPFGRRSPDPEPVAEAAPDRSAQDLEAALQRLDAVAGSRPEAEAETEAAPEPEAVVAVATPEPEAAPETPEVVAEEKPKKKRGWWPFGRREKAEPVAAVAVIDDGGTEAETATETEVAAAEAEAEKETVAERTPAPRASSLAWKMRYPGVELAEIERTSPRSMRGWAARVDAGSVEWVVTPGNGSKRGDTDGLRTSTFLTEHRCDLAINAAPFSPVELFERQPQDVNGVQATDGVLVSKANTSSPALALGRDGRGRVLSPGSYGDGTSLWDAVAGFSVVLRGGRVTGSNGDVHPRTAAGVSKDGRTIYLLVIDGRQPEHSDGATTADVGRLLKEMGAWDGLNLDGGGTTTLAVRGPGGSAEVLNRTIHGGIPGLERVSASHLGLRVK